ncbi:MAG: hypothetical protein A2591_00255 [Candidatus Yonathbacteria bacterium RIFOXYD1_FULL_52_36]|uniref:Band 7 domain-containing protein n=1 Tax=Candidatus Yonathbacteria bacterium RIFOXYD1_FULL_52_36 TaxID=1802730 RepID=A0A1G2SMF5_9BACT|nr:MAG: hypothetical protein A2591_00255 [Candidatus Yonathbacteria bacterium RIFOXYD1_FULL_52_36]
MLTVVIVIRFSTGPGVEHFGLQWSWSGLATILALLHIFASIKTRSVDEHVGVTIFEMPVLEKRSPGPFLAPYFPGMVKVWRITQNVLQNQFPGEPEQIEWRDEKEVLNELKDGKLPDGKVWPIRVPTGPAREGDRGNGLKWSNDDPFNVQMVISASFYTRYRVKNLFQFLMVVGGDTEKEALERVVKQLRDSGERVLLNELSSRNLALVIEETSKINQSMKDAFDKLTETWGADIVEVGVLMPSPGHEFNMAVREIGQTKARAQQTRITAAAEEYRLTQEGTGRGNANEQEIAGRIRGLTEANKAGIDPVVIIAATAAQDIAKNANYAYFGELGGLGGITDAIAKTLKQGGSNTQKPSPASTTGGESQ